MGDTDADSEGAATQLLVVQRQQVHELVPGGYVTESHRRWITLDGELTDSSLQSEDVEYQITRDTPENYTPIPEAPNTFVTVEASESTEVIGQVHLVSTSHEDHKP